MLKYKEQRKGVRSYSLGGALTIIESDNDSLLNIVVSTGNGFILFKIISNSFQNNFKSFSK